MPWNDNANPGPWGGPPRGDDDGRDPGPRRPDGRGPGRPEGPDFNAGFERLRRRLRLMLGGPGGLRPGVLGAVVGVAFAIWAASGLYVVAPNEQGLVLTFGAYSRPSPPGLRYHLPFPIESVELVPVTSLNKVDIGGARPGEAPQESLMLTGDQDIVDLNFTVFWRVANPAQYAFATRNPKDAVRAVAESAMREVVGKTTLNQISTTGRLQVQQQTAELMQRILDSWGAGVTVVEVQVRSADPPEPVKAAFRDVTRADQDRQAAVNEANTYYNRVVNEAKGDAARILQGAEAYRAQAELEAKGEAARFNQLYAEYRRAPDVTRQRLYIETMQRILQNSNKVIVDAKGATAPIILPPDVFKPRGPAAPPTPTPAQQAQPQAAQGDAAQAARTPQ
jgi:membrane protease subunit HflK